jgi:hypothetical protein
MAFFTSGQVIISNSTRGGRAVEVFVWAAIAEGASVTARIRRRDFKAWTPWNGRARPLDLEMGSAEDN